MEGSLKGAIIFKFALHLFALVLFLDMILLYCSANVGDAAVFILHSRREGCEGQG